MYEAIKISAVDLETALLGEVRVFSFDESASILGYCSKVETDIL